MRSSSEFLKQVEGSAAEGFWNGIDRESGVANQRAKSAVKEPLFKRLLRKMFPDERKQERIPVPPLLGYLGTMRGTSPYEIGDISSTGFCMVTDERWETGTEMPVTLQRTNVAEESEVDCFTVQAKVVRRGQEGVGFSIVLSEEESDAARGNRLRVKWASKPEMERFLQRLKVEQESAPGQSGIAQTEPVFLGAAQTTLRHSAGD